VNSRASGLTRVYTDALPSYDHLGLYYNHAVIDHAECYARGEVHTNGLENFWSLLKRGINGTYVSVEPFHLFRYLDEQAFRFNERDLTDSERFRIVMGNIVGRRLTYDALIGESDRPERP
jgi:ISXO2 transposase-like protein